MTRSLHRGGRGLEKVGVPADGQVRVPAPCSSCSRSMSLTATLMASVSHRTSQGRSSIEVCEGPQADPARDRINIERRPACSATSLDLPIQAGLAMNASTPALVTAGSVTQSSNEAINSGLATGGRSPSTTRSIGRPRYSHSLVAGLRPRVRHKGAPPSSTDRTPRLSPALHGHPLHPNAYRDEADPCRSTLIP